MGKNRNPDNPRRARREARTDAWSDRRAGGFGKGKIRRRPRERSEEASAAYEQTYVRHTPRRWRSS